MALSANAAASAMTVTAVTVVDVEAGGSGQKVAKRLPRRSVTGPVPMAWRFLSTIASLALLPSSKQCAPFVRHVVPPPPLGARPAQRRYRVHEGLRYMRRWECIGIIWVAKPVSNYAGDKWRSCRKELET